jgi:hypothetical protein
VATTLTFFEQVTAIGLEVLAAAAPAVTILEVGLGGRLDATTAVDAPIAAVTGVALDHQEYLGDTVAAIAVEKAGIWKPGQRAIVGAAGDPVAQPILIAAARAAGVATLDVVDAAALARAPTTALAGAHQRENAACADAIVDALVALGAIAAPPEVRAAGYAAAVHPGRCEVVATAPTVLLDGAHNPDGARALANAIAARPERPRALVLAVSADKDVGGDRRAPGRRGRRRDRQPLRPAAVDGAAGPGRDRASRGRAGRDRRRPRGRGRPRARRGRAGRAGGDRRLAVRGRRGPPAVPRDGDRSAGRHRPGAGAVTAKFAPGGPAS